MEFLEKPRAGQQSASKDSTTASAIQPVEHLKLSVNTKPNINLADTCRIRVGRRRIVNKDSRELSNSRDNEMASKRPEPIFEILFDGPGLYPEKIPVATLASTLSAVQRLAGGEPNLEDEDDQRTDESVEDDRSLRLLDIKRGSAAFRLSAPPARTRSIAFVQSVDF